MRETLLKIVALQRVDDRLDRVRDELRALPARREAAEAERDATQAAREEATSRLEQAELRVRELEGQVADTKAHKVHLEGQTAQVKSNEAYRVLLSEIEGDKERIGRLEDDELEAMEAAETAREELSGATARASSVAARVEDELARMAAREAELAEESERLQAERTEAAARVEPELVARYDKVAVRRRPVVAIVSKEVCSGCRVGIPAQDFVELIQAARIVECASCKRILVHERVLGEAP